MNNQSPIIGAHGHVSPATRSDHYDLWHIIAVFGHVLAKVAGQNQIDRRLVVAVTFREFHRIRLRQTDETVTDGCQT